MTAESHNDILDEKTLGRGKKQQPNTDYEASAHHFRIGSWKKTEVGVGVRLDTLHGTLKLFCFVNPHMRTFPH